MTHSKSILPLLVAVALALSGCSETTRGHSRCLRVVHGDTLGLICDGERTSVQLFGVDAQEHGQPGRAGATQWLRERTDGRAARLSLPEKRKRDNFSRLLCSVSIDGCELAAAILAEQLAVAGER